MNLATLRVEGDDETLALLCDALGRNFDNTWKKGEPKRRGGTHTLSGFGLTLADSDNPGEMVASIRQFLAECKVLGLAFSGTNLSSELAIGVTVGDSVQFVAFVDLTVADLSLLCSLGINLSVAAYPTSDEANATGDKK
ncbi:hypothetical protein [Cupriavidus sp. YAF13]|uniref:hypothetical protein n=1 Tax=Cupriavidus sp. YAF13 TaxID=3233075 RepID=UPI003F93F4C2